jgi:hypothetical protein
MTTVLDSSPMSVVDALRGDRARRPRTDTTSSAGLRATLDDGIYDIIGAKQLATPVVVRASSLHQRTNTTDLSMSSHGRLRGVLVSQILRLLSVGISIDHAFDDAVAAWRSEVGSSELLDQLDRLDDDERARLATDLSAHYVALTRALGPIPARWLPRSGVRASQRLAGGSVILRDVVDLMIGTTTSDVASVALFDVTTSPLGEGAERTMRFHALVQTLRTSSVPLRTCTFSTATGELWIHDVDYELLARSVDEVLAAVSSLWTPL